jgi:hypothetical protein
MLVHAKLDAVISAGCPLSVIAHTLLLTHHRRLTLRELAPTNASRSKGERGRYQYVLSPVRRQSSMPEFLPTFNCR